MLFSLYCIHYRHNFTVSFEFIAWLCKRLYLWCPDPAFYVQTPQILWPAIALCSTHAVKIKFELFELKSIWKALKDERSAPRDTVRITKGAGVKPEVFVKIKLSEIAFLVEDQKMLSTNVPKSREDKKGRITNSLCLL